MGLHRALPLLLAAAVVADRRDITNQEPRRTRNDKDRVLVAGASWVNGKVPLSCGWEGAKACFALVTLEHGGNCSWAPGCGASGEGAYGTCGWGEGRILVYLSDSLSMGPWTDAVELLPAAARPKGSYSRPRLLFSPTTLLYTLWVRWVPPEGGPSHLLVATSSTLDATGFKVLHERAPLADGSAAGGSRTGAGAFLIDADAQAYVARSGSADGGATWSVTVERLIPDWSASAATTDVTQRSGIVGPSGVASPSTSTLFFKRGDAYYVAFAPGACCYCEGGGGDALAFASTSPLGPYKPVGSLGTALLGAQSDAVLVHENVKGVLWSGSRWGISGPLDDTPTAWAMVDFWAPASGGPSWVRPLEWRDTFQLETN